MIQYTGKYLKDSRDDLFYKVSKKMSSSRFQHVLRVEEMALKLARIYHEDLEKTSIAALVHDYAKERPDHDFICQMTKKNYSPELLKYHNQIWHGTVGADFVSEELGINDEDILNAVRTHTTGAAQMSKLMQIIYVADFIEEGRKFPGVEEARRRSFESLEKGVAFKTKHTLEYLLSRQALIYPQTIETYNAWVAK